MFLYFSKGKYTDYRKELIEDLKDRDEATAYLNAAWEESLKGDDESQKLFLCALCALCG